MRTVRSADVTSLVEEMCVKSCIFLPEDVAAAVDCAFENETSRAAKDALGDIIKNREIASEDSLPMCQDTGMVCVFVKIGQEVYVEGPLEDSINEGVRRGYTKGYLRKSVVGDPLERKNTGDNTPACIYYSIVPGDALEITVAPKGAGSENMSSIAMLSPADGEDGIKRFIIEAVKRADANPCPPIIVGVGIGGNFDKAALHSKLALLRPLNECNTDPRYAILEKELTDSINALGIGAMGYGGQTTCLGVNIIAAPTHIAMLPVAVNINCHCARHISGKL